MAKNKETDAELKELKAKLLEGKALIGKERVLKELKNDCLQRVYIARNCPQNLKEELEYLAKLIKIPLFGLSLDNEELGVFCKKNFFVSVVGIVK